ncbi:hypothetical protein Ancab_035139 [Ancistrocladus abbreviatus]
MLPILQPLPFISPTPTAESFSPHQHQYCEAYFILSVTGVMDSPAKQPNTQFGCHQCNHSHTITFKRSRHHHYGHHYSGRHSSGHKNTSASRNKSAPVKVAGRCSSEFGHNRGRHFTERREKGVYREERIGSGSLVVDALLDAAMSSELAQMVCEICQQSIRWFVVVAVLVCGHVYHAECLEDTTHFDDIRDPPCPVCSVSVSEAEAA